MALFNDNSMYKCSQCGSPYFQEIEVKSYQKDPQTNQVETIISKNLVLVCQQCGNKVSCIDKQNLFKDK